MDQLTPDTFDRTAKLFVDRQGVTPVEARRKLSSFRLKMSLGPEVASSPTLQLSVLTAVNIAMRCFGGPVIIDLVKGLDDPKLSLPWASDTTLLNAIKSISPNGGMGDLLSTKVDGHLVFGTRDDVADGLQVTFNGWSVAVVPVVEQKRLAEYERCPIAGVAAGALAVSELFHSFAGIAIEASRRAVGLSLWRPDLNWYDEAAVGYEVKYVPAEFWLLGLGHLGQAYLWAISFLPFEDREKVNLLLQDFDHVVDANVGTGLLTNRTHIGRLKTRVAMEWLESIGFRPRIVERRFDEHTKLTDGEPGLALCGFDNQGPRWALDKTGFEHVVECGLGGRADNFNAISLHSLSDSSRRACEIWPKETKAGRKNDDERIQKLAKRNPVYREFRERHQCGHLELAGKSIAVPFVGAIAGSFVVAETLRILNGGDRYNHIGIRLDCPEFTDTVRRTKCTNPRISFQPVMRFAPRTHSQVG